MGRLSKSVILSIFGILAAGASVVTLASLWRSWEATGKDYWTLALVILVMLAALWLFMWRSAQRWIQSFISCMSLGTAVSESGLSRDDVRQLAEALRLGRKTDILPLMVKLLSKTVQLVNESSCQLGSPAKCADDGLAVGLAQGLLSLLKRENLTDIVTAQKLELLDARPATPAETSSVIKDLPVLTWLGINGQDYDDHKEKFKEAVIAHHLLSRDMFRTSNATYTFSFDMTNFCFENIRPSIKIEMLSEARNRFKDKSFDTAVCIQRGPVAGYLNSFIQELASYLNATFCPFPTRESERGQIFLEKLQDLCAGGRSTLLVEPLMLDDGELDKAYDFLTSQGATIEGVLILCQESNYPLSHLAHGSQIKELSGRKEIKGQIVVDLAPISA